MFIESQNNEKFRLQKQTDKMRRKKRDTNKNKSSSFCWHLFIERDRSTHVEHEHYGFNSRPERNRWANRLSEKRKRRKRGGRKNTNTHTHIETEWIPFDATLKINRLKMIYRICCGRKLISSKTSNIVQISNWNYDYTRRFNCIHSEPSLNWTYDSIKFYVRCTFRIGTHESATIKRINRHAHTHPFS